MSLFDMWKNKKKQKEFEEKRKYIRLGTHHLVKYKELGKGKELSFIRNIGGGGVLFYAEKDLPKDDVVELEINFPQYPHSIKANAKVLRTVKLADMGGYEVAAEFISVDEEARDFITKKIKEVSE
jgi:hypothetical protein